MKREENVRDGSFAAPIRGDEHPKFHWQRPDVEAPLVVWEYAFALERRVEQLSAQLRDMRERYGPAPRIEVM